MNFSGQMRIPSNGQMPQGMTIPMIIEGTVTVEPLKDADSEKEVAAKDG